MLITKRKKSLVGGFFQFAKVWYGYPLCMYPDTWTDALSNYLLVLAYYFEIYPFVSVCDRFYVGKFLTSVIFLYGNRSGQLPHLIEKLPQWLSGPSLVLPAATDRPPDTKPGFKQCSDALQFFIQLLAWVDIKMHKAVEAWKQKKIHK